MNTDDADGANSADTVDRRRMLDRRRLLQAAAVAGISGGAMWAAPSVLQFNASADGPPGSCTCIATPSQQFLTAANFPGTLPTTCGTPTGGGSSTYSICRSSASEPVYLWGTPATGTTTTYEPVFDDIGVVAVTEPGTSPVTRYGNIYRYQNFCRYGAGSNLPDTFVATTTTQRVYTSAAAPTIWDYLPPQPSNPTPDTADPTAWWAASQPNGTQYSVRSPGYGPPETPWTGPIDISLLFGGKCGSFNVTVTAWNRYQNSGWSNIYIGTTRPV